MAEIKTDLPFRHASQDTDGNVRPVRKRSGSTPHQQLFHSTNLLLRGYDTAKTVIAALGLALKPNIDDIRGPPLVEIVKQLAKTTRC
ncbi:hypothetical protein [Arthrobacter polaris]|uniref:hypothetical protein n=1 Tax=Arthrobacter polaris TaxID=2813727 RepID=UPI001F3BFCE9|nr:hypothetical protein [Arthrobacter polaris]UIK87668.1 hypothetical protein J0916_09010 [Arthrobacter polaris]